MAASWVEFVSVSIVGFLAWSKEDRDSKDLFTKKEEILPKIVYPIEIAYRQRLDVIVPRIKKKKTENSLMSP